MAKHIFSEENRAKALETRRKKKAARAAVSDKILAEIDVDKASLGARFLRELERIAFTNSDDDLRISAIRTGLGYCLPSLRAVEHEISGMDPININLLETESNTARHGEVDPAQWSGTPSTPEEPAGTTLPEERAPLKKLKPGVIIE